MIKPEDEGTEPGSPTGLRRSLAVQSNELERERATVAQLRAHVDTMRSTHAADIDQLQRALREALDDGEEARHQAILAAARLSGLERQVRHERIASVCLCISLAVFIFYLFLAQHPWWL